jgi:restriction system protein
LFYIEASSNNQVKLKGLKDMAKVTNRRRGEIVRGIFKILMAYSEGLQAKKVLAKLENEVPPTDFENATFPKHPNIRRFEKLARFHTIAYTKAGWLIKEKGQWSLSEEGIKAYKEFSDPEKFQEEAARLYREWEQAQSVTKEDEEETLDTATTLEEAEESAWVGIEEHIHNMNPYDFQNLVSGLIDAMGYHVYWVSPPGPDKGIDIIAHKDPLGVEGPRIKIQVKRRKDKIAVDGIRAFMAILGDGDIGLFISIGGFTRDAELEVRTQEKRRLTLLDLKKFFDLWVEYYGKIPEERKQLLPLKPVYFLSPRD